MKNLLERRTPPNNEDGQSEIPARHASKRFRQTRHPNELGQLAVVYKEEKFTVLNWSRTGIAFEVSRDLDVFESSAIIPHIKVTFDDILLLECSIEILRRKEVSDSYAQIGCSFVGTSLPAEAVESAKLLSTIRKQSKLEFEIAKNLSPEFCKSVVTFLLLLDNMKKGCEREEERVLRLPLDRKHEAEQFFLPQMSAIALEMFGSINQKISDQVDVEKLTENSEYHEVFERLIYPFFSKSPVFNRSHDKPRGYAGDYEMMNQVYRQGFEGLSLMSRILHNYGTIEGCGEAVRARRPYLLEQCQNLLSTPGRKNILSVASGPAMECQELIAGVKESELERLSLSLLDIDVEALEHAQTQILRILSEQNKHAEVHFVNESVKSLILGRQVLPFKNYDLVYSAGLFDYLDERTARVLVKRLFDVISPGGRLIIGNFTKYNSSKAFLHLLCRWTLVHRSEEDMKKLADGLTATKVAVEYDPTNNIAFLVIDKA